MQATLALDEPLTAVPGIRERRAADLRQMGMHRVRDLLTSYPRRYIDMSEVRTIAEAAIGALVTIAGTVHEVKVKRPRRNLHIVEITVVDGTGTLIVTAFNQRWLADKLSAGMRVALSGKLEFDYGFKRMTNPTIEPVEHDVEGLILPVHPACARISAAQMRGLVKRALSLTAAVLDPLPLELRLKYRLMSRGAALKSVHFPRSMREAALARRRLAFEEILMVQLLMMTESRKRSAGLEATAHRSDGPFVRALADVLPFALTDDQAAARDELFDAMAQPEAANHMILGDVGTGKTAVAAFGMAAAVDSGGQALMLVPTEVLAEQHRASLGSLLERTGMRVALLTGSTPADERAVMLGELASGTLDILIGTHALMEDDVRPAHCTLVVIDEQQRFGVDQRARLLAKGSAPDALYLTATPIPRSLALALFGNLTLSYLRQRPHAGSGRTTTVVAKADRGVAYDAAKRALARGEQVYVICALIGLDSTERKAAAGRHLGEDDDEAYYPEVAIEGAQGDPDAGLTAAVQEASFLRTNIFPDHCVELLHGALPTDEKRSVMQRFASGEIEVLVATTVVEVGVDVPNATVMIVEDADRFGLAQLHQLRGRVGRGEIPGQVFLVSASKQQPALERLRAMVRTDDGFRLAEEDLALRREGDILGNRQSGASALKLVNVVRDAAMIEEAHACAAAILAADPDLQASHNAALARELRTVFSEERCEYAVVGG